MDYIGYSAVGKTQVKTLVWSYDIVCQWMKNLRERMKSFPEAIRLHPDTTLIRAAIPDFHLIGHGAKCQTPFNFMRIGSVGRTCGEGIETEWTAINLVATSMRKMSPSARQEVLNDHWSFWNWAKTKNLGMIYTLYIA